MALAGRHFWRLMALVAWSTLIPTQLGGGATIAACMAPQCNETGLGAAPCVWSCYMWDPGSNCLELAVLVYCYIEDDDEWRQFEEGREGSCGGGPIITE
jgi:hypothetical protein